MTLKSGGAAYYEIDYTGSQAANYDLLQVNLDQNLNLTFYDSAGNVLSTSSSPAYFARGTAGLSSLSVAAPAVAPQSIIVTRNCHVNASSVAQGSCVLQRLSGSSSGYFYVRVENQTSSSVSANLYASVHLYDDPNEPGNNLESNPTVLATGSGGNSAALETLGDVDYWVVSGTGSSDSIQFDSSSAVEPRADLFASDGTPLTTLLPGDTYSPIATGDYVRVYAHNNARAGVSAASVYFLTIP